MDIQEKEEPAQNTESKNLQLYLKQKELLKTFLQHGAITRQQHDKSLHDLTEKMGFSD